MRSKGKMIYKVIGVDRKTAQDRELVCEHSTEREAMNDAYSQGIAVERVEEVKQANGSDKKAQRLKDQRENQSRVWSEHPNRKTGRSDRADYNRQVGIVAMGVFIGLLLFSCISPVIIIVVLGVLGDAGKNMGG